VSQGVTSENSALGTIEIFGPACGLVSCKPWLLLLSVAAYLLFKTL
jgi:hypothetical protein